MLMSWYKQYNKHMTEWFWTCWLHTLCFISVAVCSLKHCFVIIFWHSMISALISTDIGVHISIRVYCMKGLCEMWTWSCISPHVFTSPFPLQHFPSNFSLTYWWVTPVVLDGMYFWYVFSLESFICSPNTATCSMHTVCSLRLTLQRIVYIGVNGHHIHLPP